MSHESEKAVIVEFVLMADGRYDIHQVWTSEPGRKSYSMYDVSWTKRDRRYSFHKSGGGPFPATVSGIYWTSDPALVIEEESSWSLDGDPAMGERNKTRRLTDLPIDVKGCGDVLEWLYNYHHSAQTVYCDICVDSIPDDDLCAHIWWCDEGGDFQGVGGESISPCDCEDCVKGKAWRENAMSAIS
jgi:hypothetical protein